MNEELDSQLSAMFDDELPAAECELLARRLSRDDALKARWGRYALIGAVIRAERGVVLQSAVAGRVNAALTHEPMLVGGDGAAVARGGFANTPVWIRMISGVGVAAGVATLSILWLRFHAIEPVSTPTMTVASASPSRAHTVANTASDSYVVPPNMTQPVTPMPPTQLADYVVAHSAYSWPISGPSLLSSLMVSEPTGTLSPPVRSHQRVSGHGHATHHPH